MDSSSVVASLDERDIDVRLQSAEKRPRDLSPTRSLCVPEQMSLCNFPTSVSVCEGLQGIGGGGGGEGEVGRGAGGEGVRTSRKRSREDLDTQSVDLNFREPHSKKQRRPLTRVTSIQSLANIVKDTPFQTAKRRLKRSFSFSREHPSSPTPKYRPPSIAKTTTATRPKYCPPSSLTFRHRKSNKLQLPANWIDCVGGGEEKYSREEVKRQEALYSIFKTESELVEDLRMIINIFYHPLLRLNLISEEDHCKLFGNIQVILALHENLISDLEQLRSIGCHGECIDSIGDTLLAWSATLSPYADYCANLVTAKHTLETRRQDPAIEDFLQRCLDSEFSRKIDFWTFLDAPRSRIMKYPILLKEVKKKTPPEHSDHQLLDEAMSRFDDVLKEIDHCTGIAKCRDVINHLEYIHDDQRSGAIDESTQILCSGILRNKNGSKLHVFLLNKVLVLTRPSTRSSALGCQIYRQPIPVDSLLVEDVGDGETKISGSFRGALRVSGGSGSKYLLKVSSSDPTISRHSHTLQANGDFDKKAWLDAFRRVVPNITSRNTKRTAV